LKNLDRYFITPFFTCKINGENILRYFGYTNKKKVMKSKRKNFNGSTPTPQSETDIKKILELEMQLTDYQFRLLITFNKF